MSRAAGRERRSDRISGLTDELLLSILSELPIGDAAATAVLSKRWKGLFPSLPRFRIDFSQAGALPTFETVRSIICSRDSPLTSFHKQTTNDVHYGRFRQMVHSVSASRLGNRLRTATLYLDRILPLSIPFVQFLLMNAGVLQKMTCF
ncbi:unnamed protein product [Musa acuminata subsp. malaccensis]|uniref:(wild Malaysian banana) hypothetical protein n=1 Tax=Musa acuminata subsp. malaccensis TaxID=214687 RepID=A0A804IJQ8_MUSAM|nr:unnamed protein product [Musa acuminata subsp. malaccensis]